MQPCFDRTIFQEFPDGLLLLDEKGAILDSNQVARNLPTVTGDRLEGADFFQVFERLDHLKEIRDRFITAGREGLIRECFDTGLGGEGGEGRVAVQIRMHGLRVADGSRAVLVIVEIVQPGEDNRNAAKILRNSAKQLSDIRHDINNPLMGILGHAELLATRNDLSDSAKMSIQTIKEQSLKIRDLVLNLGRVRNSLKK